MTEEEEEETCNRTAEILSQSGVCSKRMLVSCHFFLLVPPLKSLQSIPTLCLTKVSNLRSDQAQRYINTAPNAMCSQKHKL
jgi:hypothetical protein